MLNFGFPKALSDEETKELLEQLKKHPRDRGTFERLFNGHIRIALSVLSRYMNQISGPDFDDLVNQAATEIILSIKDLQDSNLSKFVLFRTHRMIQRYLRRRKLENKTILKCSSMDNIADMKEQHNSILREMIDTLEKCIENSSEKQVIDMRLQEYNDIEIAEIMGKSKVRIGQIRKKIADKFKKHWGE